MRLARPTFCGKPLPKEATPLPGLVQPDLLDPRSPQRTCAPRVLFSSPVSRRAASFLLESRSGALTLRVPCYSTPILKTIGPTVGEHPPVDRRPETDDTTSRRGARPARSPTGAVLARANTRAFEGLRSRPCRPAPSVSGHRPSSKAPAIHSNPSGASPRVAARVFDGVGGGARRNRVASAAPGVPWIRPALWTSCSSRARASRARLLHAESPPPDPHHEWVVPAAWGVGRRAGSQLVGCSGPAQMRYSTKK